jgi:hypothetical protein
MTDEARLLEAARLTWRQAKPSDGDCQRAALRVAASLRRPTRSSRALPLLAAAVALMATLAYAGASRWRRREPPAPLAVSQPATPTSTPTPTSTSTSTPTPTPTSTPTAIAAPHPAAHTWADVSRALTAGDARSAERALRDLATRGDPATRAKATLGMAQLALARDDKSRASALARQVLAMRGIDAPLAARANEILQSAQP